MHPRHPPSQLALLADSKYHFIGLPAMATSRFGSDGNHEASNGASRWPGRFPPSIAELQGKGRASDPGGVGQQRVAPSVRNELESWLFEHERYG